MTVCCRERETLYFFFPTIFNTFIHSCDPQNSMVQISCSVLGRQEFVLPRNLVLPQSLKGPNS